MTSRVGNHGDDNDDGYGDGYGYEEWEDMMDGGGFFNQQHMYENESNNDDDREGDDEVDDEEKEENDTTDEEDTSQILSNDYLYTYQSGTNGVLVSLENDELDRIGRSIESIQLHSSIKDIRENAFRGCISLLSIDFFNNNKAINRSPSSSSPPSLSSSNVIKIGKHAFRYCNKLQSIQLPSSMQEIGEGAFNFCLGLEEIIIPNATSLTSIAPSTFSCCNSLTFIDLTTMTTSTSASTTSSTASALTEIGPFAFGNCIHLQSIRLPNSIHTIGEGAFHQCRSMKEFILPPLVASIEESTFCGCYKLERVLFGNETTVTSSSTASSTTTTKVLLKSIGDCAFQDCRSLKFMGTRKDLGKNISDDDRDTSCTLPPLIEEIGASAFQCCSGMISIDLSHCSKLREIQGQTFHQCTSLQQIHVHVGGNHDEDVRDDNRQDEHNKDGDENDNIDEDNVRIGLYGNKIARHHMARRRSRRPQPRRTNIEKIGNWAFFACSSLTVSPSFELLLLSSSSPQTLSSTSPLSSSHSSYFSSSLQEIGISAFEGCKRLGTFFSSPHHRHCQEDKYTTIVPTIQFICDINIAGGTSYLFGPSLTSSSSSPSSPSRTHIGNGSSSNTDFVDDDKPVDEDKALNTKSKIHSNNQNEKSYPISLWPLIIHRILYQMPLYKRQFFCHDGSTPDYEKYKNKQVYVCNDDIRRCSALYHLLVHGNTSIILRS